MAEPNSQRANDARDDLRRIPGFSVADEKSISLDSSGNQDRSRVRNSRVSGQAGSIIITRRL